MPSKLFRMRDWLNGAVYRLNRAGWQMRARLKKPLVGFCKCSNPKRHIFWLYVLE